jgi:hypothetical protein
MRLRRADGTVYLDRWGFGGSVLGLFLHRMAGPDPAEHVHDHPWQFVSVILWGGYYEERADTRSAPLYARLARRWPGTCTVGASEERAPLSVRLMRLDEAHRIVALRRRTSWSLVLHLPFAGAVGRNPRLPMIVTRPVEIARKKVDATA